MAITTLSGGLGTALSPNLSSIIFGIEQINLYGVNSNHLADLFENIKTINGSWNFATLPKFGTNTGFLKATSGVLSFETLESSPISLISTTTNINVISDTNVTLFTVPTGQKLIITGAYLVPTELNTFTTGFSASMGTNSAVFDNIFEIKDFTGLDTLNKIGQYISLSDLLIVNNASDVIKLKITTNATATTFKIKCVLFGFYI